MAKGFVAGFVRHHDRWVGHWLPVASSDPRTKTYKEARAELVRILAVWCGGEALARRKVVFVDGLSQHGRELLELIFDTIRDQPQPPPEA